MQRISATYRVATPMFLGGHEHEAELRLPSFKGVLRFWWRAMAWERIKNASALRDEEASLFGSSDESFGQSKVLMRFDGIAGPIPLSPPEQLKDGTQIIGPGARYFGYGVMEAFASAKKNTKEGQLTRSCLHSSFSFTVHLFLKPTLKPEQKQEIEEVLKIVGLVGGLGAKSRKGYGSLTLLSLKLDDKETWKPPANAQEVANAVRMILGPRRIRARQSAASDHHQLPEWTAFSEASRVIIVSAAGKDRTPLALLDKIGREMVRYRSWGRNGKVLGNVDSERNFKADHDLMAGQTHPQTAHPQRIAFGLPHNYGPHKEVKPESFDRRASPLLIHLHHPGENDQPIAVLTFLPSRFLLQQKDRILVAGNPVNLVTEKLWQPVESFLERMLDGTHTRKESFGPAMEVFHG